jgi:hypothetical protein
MTGESPQVITPKRVIDSVHQATIAKRAWLVGQVFARLDDQRQIVVGDEWPGN